MLIAPNEQAVYANCSPAPPRARHGATDISDVPIKSKAEFPGAKLSYTQVLIAGRSCGRLLRGQLGPGVNAALYDGRDTGAFFALQTEAWGTHSFRTETGHSLSQLDVLHQLDMGIEV